MPCFINYNSRSSKFEKKDDNLKREQYLNRSYNYFFDQKLFLDESYENSIILFHNISIRIS